MQLSRHMNHHIETIEIHGEEPKELKFPAAYKHKAAGYTVLFLSLKQGTVVTDTAGVYSMGEESRNWTPCTQTDKWQPVHLVINNPNA